MTGLDRLRGYARRMDELHVWPGGAKLREIAGQIERELEDERGYDVETVRSDAMEAWQWVREHGGMDVVRSIVENDVPLAESVMRELFPIGRPDECGNDDVMDELRRRLMPEGCEWPRYEDGEPVKLGDWAVANSGEKKGESFRVNRIWFEQGTAHMSSTLKDGHYWHWKRKDPCVRRPQVIAADGEPLEQGQTVWHVATGHEYIVRSCTNGGAHLSRDGRPAGYCRAEYLTQQRPVLDADGVPIREGDTVYGFSGQEYEVTGLCEYEPSIVHAREVGAGVASDELIAMSGALNSCQLDASQLTHTKPETPDSWERIEEDIGKLFSDYWGCKLSTCSKCPAAVDGKKPYRRFGVDNCIIARNVDLVRRCKALAERGE